MPHEHKESGPEELRRIVNCLDFTREDALDGFTAEQCVRIVRAVRACKWDIFPDNLTRDELEHAAEHGTLSEECNARLDRELV